MKFEGENLFCLESTGKEMAREENNASEAKQPLKTAKKEALGWMEWLRGWFYLVYEMLFQRILASHLQNPMPLPPINDLTCIVTGSTSGIGCEIARYALLYAYSSFPL